MKPLVSVALLLCAAGSASAAHALQNIPLDMDTLAALPHEPVDAEVHGHFLHCTGVSLAGLLRDAGAMPAEPLRGPQLARAVRVSARDGYRVAFSLAELEPTLGNARVFVVDACDGKPLDGHDGPLRLLVPGDSRPARSVRQLQAIEVVDLR